MDEQLKHKKMFGHEIFLIIIADLCTKREIKYLFQAI